MEAISVFFIVGLSFSFIFLVKRLTSSDYRRPVMMLPVIIISILTIELFYGWLYSSQFILQQPHLIRLNNPFLYVIGPAIYLLLRSFVYPEMKWKSIHLLHLIPFLIAIFYLFPLYLSDTEEKVKYISDMYHSLSFDSYLLGGTRRIHQGAYIISAITLIHTEKRTLKFQRELRASILILSAFSVLWLISIYRYLFSFNLLSGLFDSILLATIAIFLVYRQLSTRTQENHLLSKSDVEEIEGEMRKIRDFLSEKRDYLNPQYSIKDLALSLGLSVPKVSKVINRAENTNFNDLINRYKVQEAIMLLQSEQTKHLTIEAIANNAGFKSTSAFNDNFKRITGKSPKHYRKMLDK